MKQYRFVLDGYEVGGIFLESFPFDVSIRVRDDDSYEVNVVARENTKKHITDQLLSDPEKWELQAIEVVMDQLNDYPEQYINEENELK